MGNLKLDSSATEYISSLDCLQHFIKYLLIGCLKIHIGQHSFKMDGFSSHTLGFTPQGSY